VIALAERGTMFDPGPCVYMEKIAGGPQIADLLSLTDPLAEVVLRVAERRGVGVGDITVIMLDRPRHEEAVGQLREVGARIRFISDGDVSAALFAVSADAGGVDLLWGIGGTPEGVLSAAAIKCLGGQLLGRLWPRDDAERQAAIDAGYDLDEVLDVARLVSGQDVFFAATGVTDGELLQGVRFRGGKATTESLVMRSRSGTVRTVSARHDRAKLREITGGRYD
jgi:fructose-1,6-bisphosphatase II